MGSLVDGMVEEGMRLSVEAILFKQGRYSITSYTSYAVTLWKAGAKFRIYPLRTVERKCGRIMNRNNEHHRIYASEVRDRLTDRASADLRDPMDRFREIFIALLNCGDDDFQLCLKESLIVAVAMYGQLAVSENKQGCVPLLQQKL